jgi:hypothetical protein
MSQLLKITEEDQKQILEQHISQGYKTSLVENISINPNSVVAANNTIKNLTPFIKKRLYSKNIVVKEGDIQPYLNSYVNELNKKSSYISELINKNRPPQEIANVYTSTFIKVFHQMFNSQMGFAKKMLVRTLVDKKTVESSKGGLWLILFNIISQGYESLPIDQTKKDEIFEYLKKNRNPFTFDLIEFAIKSIWG